MVHGRFVRRAMPGTGSWGSGGRKTRNSLGSDCVIVIVFEHVFERVTHSSDATNSTKSMWFLAARADHDGFSHFLVNIRVIFVHVVKLWYNLKFN